MPRQVALKESFVQGIQSKLDDALLLKVLTALRTRGQYEGPERVCGASVAIMKGVRVKGKAPGNRVAAATPSHTRAPHHRHPSLIVHWGFFFLEHGLSVDRHVILCCRHYSATVQQRGWWGNPIW